MMKGQNVKGMMRTGTLARETARLAGALGLILALAVGAAVAADETSSTAVGGEWGADVTTGSAASAIDLSPEQQAVVDQINSYFNEMTNLQGDFQQFDTQQQKTRGRFYISRPGKFRFDYRKPSTLVVVSDGELLAFEDHELKSVDNYPLDSTPFRIVMAPQVDLKRDALVTEVVDSGDLASVTLGDKGGDSGGQIKLFFSKADGALELREWIIVSPQGEQTRVEVANLDRESAIDAKLFERTPLFTEATPKR